MTMDEYAEKVIAAQEELPWIKTGQYKSFSERDLIRVRQLYYLKEAPELD